MFWRKRKLNLKAASQLARLAHRLGVERRFAVRVLFPKVQLPVLPKILFMQQELAVHDISLGGCCLLDPHELLGANVGNDVHFVLSWPDGSASVHGRIVSRVDHKRHIQFLNLPQTRTDEMRWPIEFGARAQSLRRSTASDLTGPLLAAREIWTALGGDSLAIVNDASRLAQFNVDGSTYTFFKNEWPVKEGVGPLTIAQFSALIIFLSNIRQPSELVLALTEYSGQMLARGRA